MQAGKLEVFEIEYCSMNAEENFRQNTNILQKYKLPTKNSHTDKGENSHIPNKGVAYVFLVVFIHTLF